MQATFTAEAQSARRVAVNCFMLGAPSVYSAPLW